MIARNVLRLEDEPGGSRDHVQRHSHPSREVCFGKVMRHEQHKSGNRKASLCEAVLHQVSSCGRNLRVWLPNRVLGDEFRTVAGNRDPERPGVRNRHTNRMHPRDGRDLVVIGDFDHRVDKAFPREIRLIAAQQ